MKALLLLTNIHEIHREETLIAIDVLPSPPSGRIALVQKPNGVAGREAQVVRILSYEIVEGFALFELSTSFTAGCRRLLFLLVSLRIALVLIIISGGCSSCCAQSS